MNPTLAQRQASPAVPARRYPITITCVMRTRSDEEQALAKEMREFCLLRNIMFDSRLYDSYKYRHDRDEIVRLPAFHAYVNGQHQRTFYPVGRPLQHVEEVIVAYLEEKERKQRRKHKFREFVARIVARLKALTARAPTRLELEERRRQAQELEAADRRRSQSFSERHRTHSMIDWD